MAGQWESSDKWLCLLGKLSGVTSDGAVGFYQEQFVVSKVLVALMVKWNGRERGRPSKGSGLGTEK